MQYYMTAKNSSNTGIWLPCKSVILSGAKREATKEYGSGYLDDVLVICTGDGITEQRVTIASRKNRDSRWVSHTN